MYRSIAQFGAWALARAQKTEIDILDDDDISVISHTFESDSPSNEDSTKPSDGTDGTSKGAAKVGRAGDPLPPFHHHMIRQRVDRHGIIYPLAPAAALPALQIPPEEVGVIKPGPVRKWLAAKGEWDRKYARERRQVQKARARELAEGFEAFPGGESPPPSALAGRRHKDIPPETKKGRSWGMSLWSLWGSKHDEMTVRFPSRRIPSHVCKPNLHLRSSARRKPITSPKHPPLATSPNPAQAAARNHAPSTVSPPAARDHAVAPSPTKARPLVLSFVKS
jgi:hypothetical protein